MRISILFLMLSSSVFAMGNRGGWIASGGMGLTISPTKLLISPQLEYVQKQNFFWGPLVQAGLGDPGVLFTGGVSGRYLFGHHPRVKPAVEGAVGIAAGSGLSNSVGFHLMFGMGLDYVFDKTIAFSTMIRGNFAPPMKTFFLSWPIAMIRFAL